ncbi:MAG: hypothetical protein LWY06_08830 [Firmicutes bacterium]|nr:hypothetical protein [Bacillota bacterium]
MKYCQIAEKTKYRLATRGLSLLEIMISFAIATVAILTILVFFAYALDNLRVGKSVAQATAIAQRHLEALRADTDKLENLADGATGTSPEAVAETLYDPGTNEPIQYTVTTTVGRLPSPQDELIDVVIKVDWKYKDRPKNVILENYINSRH